MSDLAAEILRRRTFAIISHPDAGKTTLTEKLLLFGGAIQMAGTVKGRKAARHATSDWMRLEQQRGISVTSSVMQFPYRDCIVNLLDTPGHEDFSEDTYRTLTAVDSALMVIDCAKGVEERTIKLMEVCRLRDTPIMTFINKLDRDGRAADRAARRDRDACSASPPRRSPGRSAWDASCAASITCSRTASTCTPRASAAASARTAPSRAWRARAAREFLGEQARAFGEEIELVQGATAAVRPGGLPRRRARRRCSSARPSTTSASRSCWPPSPRTRRRRCRAQRARAQRRAAGAGAGRASCSRSRPTWIRRTATASRSCACAPGSYPRGMRLFHVRLDKEVRVADALTFMAADRAQAEEAYAGDIIGLHNHGTINIGDTFTEGERLTFTGVPNFAPEIFRRAVLKDPLKMKALQKGLSQLCEEGATQLFRPLRNNDLILGAVGQLQFEVVAFRLQDEYGVQCVFEAVTVYTARWVDGADARKLEEFRARAHDQLARRSRRRAGVPGALARQSRADARALAGHRVPRDARARRLRPPEAGWRGRAICATYGARRRSHERRHRGPGPARSARSSSTACTRPPSSSTTSCAPTCTPPSA